MKHKKETINHLQQNPETCVWYILLSSNTENNMSFLDLKLILSNFPTNLTICLRIFIFFHFKKLSLINTR